MYCIPNSKSHATVFSDKTYVFLCRSRATPYTDAEVKVMQFIYHAIIPCTLHFCMSAELIVSPNINDNPHVDHRTIQIFNL